MLDKHTAELIAAGEVVERPASVVKELTENAIDAGATAVSVSVERGGIAMIQIADNGCGIEAEYIPTAFIRHATSKIEKEEDLESIHTLGFRGEALASVASVSRIELLTKTDADEYAYLYRISGGEEQGIEPAARPVGTTITVRDLFYNTPARMKFMKKDSAEGAAASAVVTQLALSHPDVSFKLLRDGQEVLHTPGNGELLPAVYAALGREFALSLLPVSGSNGDVKVSGFVTKPLAGHGTRARQLFFVNGRLVKSQLLTAAVEEGYRNRLLKGKFPGCVLHITLPADAVDVNVHPAKTVVKFVSDKTVFDAVYHTVTSALDEEGRPPKPAEKPFFQAMTAAEFRARPDAPAPKNAVELPAGRAIGSAPARTYTPVPAPVPAPAAPVPEVRDVAPEPGKAFTAPTARPGTVYHITPPAAAAAPEPEPEQQAIEMPDVPAREEAPWRIAGEVLKTYIICEDGDGAVWLIDKHAAHERVRFDALKASPVPPMEQQLLTPAAVTLSGEEYGAVLENLPLLERCGFRCEDFGDGTVLVRALPDDVPAAEAASTLEEMAQKLLLQRADPETLRDELLHTIACKSAIKAGMTSDVTELAALVRRVQSGEIRYCPHGRPVAAKLTRYELEKMFKRA